MPKGNKIPEQRIERQNGLELIDLRYPKKVQKNGSKPDYFVKFWNELNIYTNNIISSRSAARKYILNFLKDLEKCNDTYENIFAELKDSAGIYLNCCRSDNNFSSEFLGLSRMSAGRVNNKITDLVNKISITLMENTGLEEEGKILSQALLEAYQEIYPEDAAGN